MFSFKIIVLTVRVHVLTEHLQVMDIASLAKKQYTYKSTRLIDWEQKFRDKLTTKTKGGPFQLRKFWKLFDLDGNGAVTIDEMIKSHGRVESVRCRQRGRTVANRILPSRASGSNCLILFNNLPCVILHR